ncbi:MAG: NAD-dependent epimerase/dehydratase family protein [Bacteroidia bacterium]|nr:NAD-dependent epimerase/dehydratase family protein [Bacteroidia bacterium]
MKKGIIIGGAGFIGYFTVNRLLEEGYEVTIGGRKQPEAGLFSDKVLFQEMDILTVPEEQLTEIFKGKDFVMLAAGADDRSLPDRPAFDFFYRHNVAPAKRISAAAKSAGVKQLLILGSYFSYFERKYPELRLAEHHPYIRSRKLQAEAALAVASAEMNVMIIEIPYVVGIAPHLTPLWKPLIQYVNSPFPVFYPDGGTAVITVQHLAKALVWMAENGKTGQYPLADANFSWKGFLQLLQKNPEKNLRIIPLPQWVLKLFMLPVMLYFRLRGKETGVHPVMFMDIQTNKSYLDTTFSHSIFPDDMAFVKSVFKEMVEKCP